MTATGGEGMGAAGAALGATRRFAAHGSALEAGQRSESPLHPAVGATWNQASCVRAAQCSTSQHVGRLHTREVAGSKPAAPMRIYRPMAYLMMRKRTLTARPVSPFAVGLATSL
jgi:hypothetical protein